MSPVPASALTIAGGEITLDAELLTPKLGPSANTPLYWRVLRNRRRWPLTQMQLPEWHIG